MSSNRPRIGVPVDCKLIGSDPSHVVGEKYLAAVAHAARTVPMVLPARAAGAEQASLEAQISADDQLADLDGLFLTGSPSNMEPWRYGSDAPGVGPFDPQRDGNNLALLGAAMARDMPIFTVCRGFQELNVACGGTLHTAVQEVPGLSDHRDDHDAPRERRYAPVHPVALAENGWLAELLDTHEITVNSLHSQGIDRLGSALIAEGQAPDGLIEAVRHRDHGFVVGVQWHPEWRYGDNPVSMALFNAFGEACRAFRQQRLSGD
ncbi:gamma-glutamyl-gamma-aminobutyrate hydrolase family protein [Salinisphaera sp.]|uniref:gamma-glutamyl-gamma-aminobutyrate hydrolase family protein n=1 Tax=Salinisphaera sp. TaxID=1914330 RepID=UPI002D7725D5|nr:gamma-glutamyl-gamma-aminobutyrate hydrolase family protein [Salinisphaera sp.]HET7313958.1 gamma-glutamyl-gamma-aminobutyrate hydrolase family protein [Salinisphaera sp.]